MADDYSMENNYNAEQQLRRTGKSVSHYILLTCYSFSKLFNSGQSTEVSMRSNISANS